MNQSNNQQSGAVSLFVVIFSALLITVITVSFVRIMNQEQQASLTSDLSQSAYDSAQAGVEDAKRVLLAESRGDRQAGDAINAKRCDTISAANVAGTTVGSNAETPIQTSTSNTNKLDQAYTCVIIHKATDDYLAQLQADQTIMIPLRSEAAISKVKISWLLQAQDAVSVAQAETALNRLRDFDNKLPGRSGWGEAAPALLRAQIISPEKSSSDRSFSLEELDSSESTQTVFLYPNTIGAINNEHNMNTMTRRSADVNEPARVRCSIDNYRNGDYLCTMTLNLAREIPAGSEVANLRLGALYQKSAIRVQLQDASGQTVRFDGVQPMVDSTGRANDVFRRVESRLSIGLSDFAYPEAAVDINGSLCKDFYVTDTDAGGAICRP